jgi:ribosomal protein L7Ae-like RNA K-turn-binding protein
LDKPSQKLPTSTWRELLEDKSDKAPTFSFTPQGSKAPPSAALTAPALETNNGVKEEPEWMQYLSKVAEGRTARPSNLKPGQGRVSTSLDRPSCSSLSPEPDTGSHLFQTSEYLKILKDAPKKVAGAKPKRKPAVQAASAPAAPAAQADLLLDVLPGPMRWTTAWRAQVARTDITLADRGDVADKGVLSYAQDDTFLEKLNIDEDLSDPAYLSEVESTAFRGPSKKTASFHFLGRRPRHTDTRIRSYVMQDLSCYLDNLVAKMLLRLQRFTEEGKSMMEANAPRRFIIGLREVSRRMKKNKLACIVVAPDIEEDQEDGGLDDRMRELLASAYSNSIPVIFALSRARIGCAMGKTVQVSVFAVMDATGAQTLLDESVSLAQELKQSWLERVELEDSKKKKPAPEAPTAPWRRAVASSGSISVPCAGRAA